MLVEISFCLGNVEIYKEAIRNSEKFSIENSDFYQNNLIKFWIYPEKNHLTLLLYPLKYYS